MNVSVKAFWKECARWWTKRAALTGSAIFLTLPAFAQVPWQTHAPQIAAMPAPRAELPPFFFGMGPLAVGPLAGVEGFGARPSGAGPLQGVGPIAGAAPVIDVHAQAGRPVIPYGDGVPFTLWGSNTVMLASLPQEALLRQSPEKDPSIIVESLPDFSLPVFGAPWAAQPDWAAPQPYEIKESYPVAPEYRPPLLPPRVSCYSASCT